ncbi:MAG: creatininase family protein [Bacteroidota bacterium]
MLSNSRNIELKFKTWKQIEEHLKTSDLIIVPIGAIEQHGPSCPLFTDTLLAEFFALQVGILNEVLVAPTISIGDSLIHLNYPGTISLNPTTLIAVIKDYINSLYRAGFRRFLIINGHGDNLGSIMAAFSELGNELKSLKYISKDFWDFSGFRKIMQDEFGDPNGGHADATDASILLAIDESLVDKSLLTKEYAKVRYWVSNDLASELYSKSGVINSDQNLASALIGCKLIEESIKGYSQLLKDLNE